MPDLDDRLRDAMHDPRRSLPTWDEPARRIRRVARRRHHRQLATAGVLVAAVGATVLASVQHRPSTVTLRSAPEATASQYPVATSTPTGPPKKTGVAGELSATSTPGVLFPAAVPVLPGAGAGVISSCPNPRGLQTPNPTATDELRAIEASLSVTVVEQRLAADRAWWPKLVANNYAATAAPILYSGPLLATYPQLGVPDPSGWISAACGEPTAQKSLVVVTGHLNRGALQEAFVFVQRQGDLLLYFEYP